MIRHTLSPSSDKQQSHTLTADNPQAYMESQLLKLGDNVDQINLYARLKDFYKVFEMGSLLATTNMGVRAYQATNTKISDDAQWKSSAKWGRRADGANAIFQGGLSYYSAWLDEKAAVRTYEKAVKEELNLDRPVTFSDLSKSNNPIIHDTAAYYSEKAFQRAWPDAFGLVRFVPLAAKALMGEKGYEATKALEAIPGTTLGLGMKSFFFSWYFTSRKTGTNYEMVRIWNKTEGVSERPNRALNQGVNPGELVTSEDITALYEAYRNDYQKRDFTVDDPLTARLFEQVARYLNHNYIPKLYINKRPDLFDTELNPEIGQERIRDLDNTHLTHANLVEFLGTGGFDIDAAIATAIRLEVMAHKGTEAYQAVSKRLETIERPSETLMPEEYKTKMLDYVNKLNQVAESALGGVWPPTYVKKRINKGIFDSYYKDQPVPADLQHAVDVLFEKYDHRTPDMTTHAPTNEASPPESWVTQVDRAENRDFSRAIEPKTLLPTPKEDFRTEALKPAAAYNSLSV